MKNKQLDRPTPETDAELNLFLRHGEAHQVSVSWIEFARKLERERDEAREQWGKASMDAAQLLSEKTKVMAERDEVRKEIEFLVSGKAQGAFEQLSEKIHKEMTIDDIRELLNKPR